MQLIPFIASFLIVGLAELGDKTQMLTIALASKFPMDKVIYGVSLASAAIMLLAVLVGAVIQRIIPMLFISIFAGAFFIIYGLMLIRPIKGKEEKEEKLYEAKDVLWTVFGTFFVAEIGDKTQLATFALAAKYRAPLQVWLGATLGMIVVNLFGIMIGNIIRNYLPERASNFLSGVIFILFGFITFLVMVLKVS